jgi:hypothetical protein
VFKSWRQDDKYFTQLQNLFQNTNNEDDLLDLTKNLTHMLNYTNCWPKDWLSRDLGNVRVLGVNYNSVLSYWIANYYYDKDENAIKTRSTTILKQLLMAGFGDRPTVFVCHSMGGIIVKGKRVVDRSPLRFQPDRIVFFLLFEELMLELHANKHLGILNNIRGIVFYSTPHLGSPLAKRAVELKLALLPSREIKELVLNNSYLLKLNVDFLKLCKSLDTLSIVSITEALDTYVGYNITTRVVPEYSSNLNVGHHHHVNKDHFYVCKPESKDSLIYKCVVDLVESISAQERFQDDQLNTAKPMVFLDNLFAEFS